MLSLFTVVEKLGSAFSEAMLNATRAPTISGGLCLVILLFVLFVAIHELFFCAGALANKILAHSFGSSTKAEMCILTLIAAISVLVARERAHEAADLYELITGARSHTDVAAFMEEAVAMALGMCALAAMFGLLQLPGLPKVLKTAIIASLCTLAPKTEGISPSFAARIFCRMHAGSPNLLPYKSEGLDSAWGYLTYWVFMRSMLKCDTVQKKLLHSYEKIFCNGA